MPTADERQRSLATYNVAAKHGGPRLWRYTYVEKDGPRDDPREPVSGDYEQPDASQVCKQQVDVLQGHVLVSLPHRPVDLHVACRSLSNLILRNDPVKAYARHLRNE